MGNKLQAILNLAARVEKCPGDRDVARMLAADLLDFCDEHVMVRVATNDGVEVEAFVPLDSPLRLRTAKIVSAS